MKQELDQVTINGVVYTRQEPEKDEQTSASVNCASIQPVEETYSMIRSESAGVFFGVILEHKLQEMTVIVRNCRRVWYWSGAASISQLAVDGTSRADECKFPAEVALATIAKVIEVIPMTAKAVQSLKGVKAWKL